MQRVNNGRLSTIGYLAPNSSRLSYLDLTNYPHNRFHNDVIQSQNDIENNSDSDSETNILSSSYQENNPIIPIIRHPQNVINPNHSENEDEDNEDNEDNEQITRGYVNRITRRFEIMESIANADSPQNEIELEDRPPSIPPPLPPRINNYNDSEYDPEYDPQNDTEQSQFVNINVTCCILLLSWIHLFCTF